MVINRLLYLALLILSLVFYFASGIWFSWLLLVLAVSLPILTLVISLPAMLSCKMEANMLDSVEQGANAALHMQMRAWRYLPMPDMQICLNLRTRDQERDIRYLSRMSREEGVLNLPTETCGYLVPEFRKGKTYDALGLFRLPMRLPKLSPLAILPPEREPAVMPELTQFLQQILKPKPGGGYAEQYEHRAYRPGDPVKDIHWKLSLKTDELVVREPLELVRHRIVLALRTPRGAESRALNLGNLRYLSNWLLENNLAHQAAWMDGDKLRIANISSRDDVLRAVRAACLVSENTEDLPWPLSLRAERIYAVGLEGGRLE